MPFPYAARRTVHYRPAVVVAAGLGLDGILIWVAMITAAENRRWPGDVGLADHVAANLPIPSVVRTSKLATIAASRAEKRGELSMTELEAVRAEIADRMGLPFPGGFHE